MNIHIRRANTTDGPAISDMLRALGWFPHINAESPQATQQRVHRHLASCTSNQSHLVLVAQTGSSEIVGYCAVHWLPYLLLPGLEGYVSELFIQEKFRGQGIGKKLLNRVKEQAFQRGCSRLMLLNMRNRESYGRQFYTKQGWVERPQAANFVLHLGKYD